MTSLNELITTHAAAPAAAEDWVSVAAALNAATVHRTSAGTLTSMAQTLSRLSPGEIEPTLQAFGLSALGQAGLAKLAANGLDFAHPLTVGLIEAMRAALPAGVADKLLAIGVWMVSPAVAANLGVVTANECRDAVQEAAAQAAAEAAAQAAAEAEAAVMTRNNAWRERFDASLNTIGTAESEVGVAAVRAIADEMEAQ